jgi:hypothetical protein
MRSILVWTTVLLFTGLFDAHARSYAPHKDEKSGQLAIWRPTEQEYVDEADEHFVRAGFTERELAHKI